MVLREFIFLISARYAYLTRIRMTSNDVSERKPVLVEDQ